MFLKFLAALLVNILFLRDTFADDHHDHGMHHGGTVQSCPPLWTRFNDNCYQFFGAATTWADAEAHCNGFFTQKTQAHLISIHSKAESDFVYKLWHDSLIESSQYVCTISPNNYGLTPANSIYLGLNDMAVEGDYVWTDGSTFDYSEWGPGEPSNGGSSPGEDCTHWMDKTIGHNSKPWNDLRCDYTTLFSYVCKLEVE
ncbi:echinoidin-like [Amphiura filiformis]|uniref:echinoidin-like n=1 Tax=Amphiura filiformis TaxID=82378 RepID=UPI003B20E832